MKNKILRISGLLVLTGFMSSCYYNPALYPSYSAGVSVSASSYVPDTSQVWVSATYDTNGFPIYGYNYGRPVYGYTAAGAAIFTLGALTALSCVPDWGYADWYRGSYRYPSHIRRYHAPPRYPKAHRPQYRPSHKPSHNPGKRPNNTTIINNNTVINKNHVNKNNTVRHNSTHNVRHNAVTKNNVTKNHVTKNNPRNNWKQGPNSSSRPTKSNANTKSQHTIRTNTHSNTRTNTSTRTNTRTNTRTHTDRSSGGGRSNRGRQ